MDKKRLSTNLLYILSFIPSFVKNEIVALRDAGVNVRIIMLCSPDAQNTSTWGQITGNHQNVVYAPDAKRFTNKLIWLIFDSICLLTHLYPNGLSHLQRVLTKHGTMNLDELRYLRRAMGITRIASKFEASRIHTHFAWNNATVAANVARLLRIPFSLTLHANDIFGLNKEHGAALSSLFEQADRIITISQFNKDLLIRNHDRLNFLHQRIRVVHCGICTELFSPSKAPRSYEGIFRVATLPSGFVEKKGLSILLRAIKILWESGKKIECIVIGDENKQGRRKQYEEEAYRLGISSIVKFPGLISQTELPKLYQHCHAFALPCVVDSRGKMDGIPVSIMEAMAAGLPVVSTRISGIPELVEHNVTGFLARPGDAFDLANQLKNIMDEKAKVRTITKAAREKIESEFNIKVTARELIRNLSQSKVIL